VLSLDCLWDRTLKFVLEKRVQIQKGKGFDSFAEG
jgi:hypothetical protein